MKDELRREGRLCFRYWVEEHKGIFRRRWYLWCSPICGGPYGYRLPYSKKTREEWTPGEMDACMHEWLRFIGLANSCPPVVREELE